MAPRSSKEIEGKFVAVARTFILGQSAQKGTPQVEVMFEILSEGPFLGESVPWSGYFTEKTEARTVESLMFMGWDGLKSIGDLTAEDVGAQVQIVVEMDEYTSERGNTYRSPRVAWVNDPNSGGVTVKEMDAGKKAAFAERMKGLALGLKQKKGEAASADPTAFDYGANAKAPPPQQQRPPQAAAAGGRKF